jgi:hypothetical protein
MGTHFTAEPTESRSIFQVNRRMRNRTLAVWEDGGREAPSSPISKLVKIGILVCKPGRDQ